MCVFYVKPTNNLSIIPLLSLKTEQRFSVFGTCFDVSNIIIISHYEYIVKMFTKVVGIYNSSYTMKLYKFK